MKNIFLVFGYGVPKDILQDEKYNMYLKLVFNKIYDVTTRSKIDDPVIIFSGGKTDMQKPYHRTEAGEMIRFFKELCQRDTVKNITKNWLLVGEKQAISTLENFVFCNEIIKKQKISQANIFIFCEQTRQKRIQILSRKIFAQKYKTTVVAFDFDTSEQRYLDPKFLKKKEKVELEHSLWALQNSANLKKHHEIFQEKFDLLRKTNPALRQEALKKWWEEKLAVKNF